MCRWANYAVYCGIVVTDDAAAQRRDAYQLHAQPPFKNLQPLQFLPQVLAGASAGHIEKWREDTGDVGRLVHDAAAGGEDGVKERGGVGEGEGRLHEGVQRG